MAFTVTLVDVQPSGNRFDCVAVFEDQSIGHASKEHLFGASLEEIKGVAKRRIAELTPGGSDAFKQIAGELNQPLDLEPTVIEPTALQLFQANVGLLRAALRGVEMGVIATDSKEVIDARAVVLSELAKSPEWVKFL